MNGSASMNVVVTKSNLVRIARLTRILHTGRFAVM